MARRSKIALVTLIAGLLSLVFVATVNADNYCDAGAYSDCVQVATPDDAATLHVEAVQVPARVSSERAKFLEANTTLGMVATDDTSVARTTYSPKLIEANTNLGMTEATAPTVVTTSQFKFLEANMVTAAYPYGETVTPMRGPR